jgi:hypothetical protein
MEVKYTHTELVDLVYELQRELSIMFVSTGIDALINISSPYFHNIGYGNFTWQRVKYPDEFKDGVWALAIDIREYKNAYGEEITPNISKSEITSSGYIRNRDSLSFSKKCLPENKVKWFNTTWTGGRIVLIIFKDGTLKRVPTDYVSYAQQIDKCKGVKKVIKIIQELCVHPFIRCTRRNEIIKSELYERVSAPSVIIHQECFIAL